MVGWPAKGISSAVVKMSIVREDGDDLLVGWMKMVSERLNSRAISCFCSWVMGEEEGESGRKTTPKGLPEYGWVVKTSRVAKRSD